MSQNFWELSAYESFAAATLEEKMNIKNTASKLDDFTRYEIKLGEKVLGLHIVDQGFDGSNLGSIWFGRSMFSYR